LAAKEGSTVSTPCASQPDSGRLRMVPPVRPLKHPPRWQTLLVLTAIPSRNGARLPAGVAVDTCLIRRVGGSSYRRPHPHPKRGPRSRWDRRSRFSYFVEEKWYGRLPPRER
jgi:hypothetical protein